MDRNYTEAIASIRSLADGETDTIALMATTACELFQRLDGFDWVGFYRNVGNQTLKIGPYQGGHGCLTIPFSKGVCGEAARTRKTVIVDDVDQFPGHIACATSTRSEIVLPVLDGNGHLIAVLDIDSDRPAAFDKSDAAVLEKLLSGLFSTPS